MNLFFRKKKNMFSQYQRLYCVFFALFSISDFVVNFLFLFHRIATVETTLWMQIFDSNSEPTSTVKIFFYIFSFFIHSFLMKNEITDGKIYLFYCKAFQQLYSYLKLEMNNKQIKFKMRREWENNCNFSAEFSLMSSTIQRKSITRLTQKMF